MKFLLMLMADEHAGAAIPTDQMAGFMAQLAAYQETLTKSGAFVATAALQPTGTARTISTAGGELKVHDGPYADTRERFGGYYIIEAADMDEAIRLAALCPAASWGKIEVRAYHPGYSPG
jgi:hypothetical protein